MLLNGFCVHRRQSRPLAGERNTAALLVKPKASRSAASSHQISISRHVLIVGFGTDGAVETILFGVKGEEAFDIGHKFTH
ncbi:unnamed protein product [Caenorhabditis auriculariae]|uniref:Uncharacterized protein n=1 Tax=Caenorhabditis auriculariae TaxID=2777116 RepID=A0A8S1H126_9PELO|nr:unnamed protein product [Caenorhabditis auriculariae]